MGARLTLHIRIIGAAAAFWTDPIDVLVRVFDIARFAVDAVLRIDLEAFGAVWFLNPLIDTCRAIAIRRPIEMFQL